MKKLIAALILPAAVICIMCSCSSAQDWDKEAVKAAEEWLVLVDAGDYGGSWEAAAEYFQKAITKESWIRSIQGVRPALGEITSRSVKSAKHYSSLPGAPDGEYVVIQFSASFENKKLAVETVTPMKDPDGRWRVSGYYIK